MVSILPTINLIQFYNYGNIVHLDLNILFSSISTMPCASGIALHSGDGHISVANEIVLMYHRSICTVANHLDFEKANTGWQNEEQRRNMDTWMC